jgi:transcriptional regulator with XRE-family HTH domain
MGAKSQNRPKNLAGKLLQIRNALGLSQSEMLRRLGAQDSFSAARISEYETGAREPSFWMLLNYGRVARVHVESLIDDTATLPHKLPGNFNFSRSQQKRAQRSARSQASVANSSDNQK